MEHFSSLNNYYLDEKQSDWANKQDLKVEGHHKSINQAPVETAFQDFYSQQTPLKKVKLEDNRVVESYIEPHANDLTIKIDDEAILNSSILSDILAKHPNLFKLVIPGNGLQDLVRKVASYFSRIKGELNLISF